MNTQLTPSTPGRPRGGAGPSFDPQEAAAPCGHPAAAVAGVSDQATSIKHAALALSLGVGALGLLDSWALGGSVLRPVQLAADRATRIAQGDLRPLAIAMTTDEPGEGGGDGVDGGERGSGSLGHPARDRSERG